MHTALQRMRALIAIKSCSVSQRTCLDKQPAKRLLDRRPSLCKARKNVLQQGFGRFPRAVVSVDCSMHVHVLLRSSHQNGQADIPL